MIRLLFVPAHNDEPLRLVECEGSLGDLQGLVGGYIQAVTLNAFSNHTLYCDEEGKLKQSPFNVRATYILHAGVGAIYDVIVGDAVVAGPMDDQGEDTDVGAPFTDMV